jgi:selenide,water dikinase
VVRGLPSFNDPNLIVGAEGFSDAGAYRVRDDLLIVQSLDFFPPLVDDPFLFGQIAAANSLSDVYAMGARPITALNIVGFPDDKLELDTLADILRGGADRVQQAGAVIAGGHSVRDHEIKYGLSVTGVVEKDRLITNREARAGDRLVLTKPLGTGFVTTAAKAGRCPREVLEAATASMSQLNRVASEAMQQVGGHAATDITGFGLAGHALELALASDVAVHIELNRLPLLPGAVELARRGNKTRASATNRSFVQPHLDCSQAADAELVELAFDAQTSGGLLISVPADGAEHLVQLAREGGAAAATVVGRVEARTGASLVLH